MLHCGLVVDWVQNSSVSDLTLMVDFGFGFNRFETFTIFRIRVHQVSKNPLGLGRVFGL